MAQVHRNRPPQLEKKEKRKWKRGRFSKIKKHLPKQLVKKWFKRLVLAGVVCFLMGMIYLIGAFAWYSKDLPDPNKILDRKLSQSTKIYDRTGEVLLYDVHGDEKRTLVKLEDIPDYVKWATISAEDKTFYEHSGFNLLAMFKGVIVDPLLGRRVRGGSTLTQQFVKNAILTNERRLSRKIKEFILSYKIEKAFEKDEILQMYLNEIPYGSVAYGVQSASQTFFGKDVEGLTLGEATVLAALPQAPTFYSPYGSNVDGLFVRQGYVLDQMVKNGYISQEEADVATEEEIKFVVKRESITAPHFVMYIKQILSEKLGDDLLENGGLRVITTLDAEKQEMAETAVVNGVEARGEQYGFHNAALLSIDPSNGNILAMVGSKDYFDIENDGNVNVTLSNRQPGSSMKPLVYAAAFDMGYTPDTILYDVETTFKTDTKDYHPLNYDLVEHGPVTIRKALQGSLNIPAVKAIYLVGVQKVVDLLELMGYTTFEDRSRFGLSLVLGGGEVKLLEHTSAYGSIANQGVYHEPVGILSVEDSKGNVLMEYKEKKRKVMDRDIANLLSNVLSDNEARAYVFGLSSYLNIGRPAGAKTGTTNDYRDAWTMGYTPDLVAGVWVGNNDNSEMNRGAAGGVVAAPIWSEYMQAALKGVPSTGFAQVEIVKTGKAVLDGEIGGEQKINIDKYTGKRATDLTPKSYIEEKTFRQAHSILHYVYRDDPKGGVPEEPGSADPAYVYWEQGIKDWLLAKLEDEGETSELVFESPPTEFDDVHTEENRPTVFINSPSDNAKIQDKNIEVDVNVFAPRGVDRVEYFIGNKLIKTVFSYPFDLSTSLGSYLERGYHKLRVVAYDDVDNSNEATININVMVDFPAPNVSWQVPEGNLSYSSSDFPVEFTVELTDRLGTQKIDFYQRNVGSGQTNLFSSTVLPGDDYLKVSWPEVFESGAYQLYGEITDPNGSKHRTVSIEVNL